MQIFYAPNIVQSEYTLNEEESKHCIRVLRLNKGDQIALVDGKGNFYNTIIEDPSFKRCQVKIINIQKNFEKRGYNLHIAIAPTKNIERLEWFLEKATEIGIDEITPIICNHSERKSVNQDRLEKIIISAMKQSIKAYLPTLHPITDFKTFVGYSSNENKFIAHCQSKNLPDLKSFSHCFGDCCILIGPEGDFSDSEIGSAKLNGYIEVSLVKSRLRTETAGIIACSTVSLSS